jgi:hypothetical protein
LFRGYVDFVFNAFFHVLNNALQSRAQVIRAKHSIKTKSHESASWKKKNPAAAARVTC